MAQKLASDISVEPRRRGRPAKAASVASNARLTIVEAAAREFSRDGYDATSMRAIARSAGVDPALVRHYFTDKADLFSESVAAPMRADLIVAAVLAGPLEQIGENLVRYVVEALDKPKQSTRILRVLHTALDQEFAAAILHQFMIHEILQRIAAQFGDDDVDLRASFAATQLVGLVIARYGLAIEPLASASPETVVRRVGPVVQMHLAGSQ